MAKVVADATAGRQVASFVLGSVATLAVLLLLQHRPEELSRRPLSSVQFVGIRGRRNATSSAEAAIITTGGDGGVAAGDDNVTKQPPAGGPTRSLPSSSGDRQQEVGFSLLFSSRWIDDELIPL
jgi:hypothetical protein